VNGGISAGDDDVERVDLELEGRLDGLEVAVSPEEVDDQRGEHAAPATEQLHQVGEVERVGLVEQDVPDRAHARPHVDAAQEAQAAEDADRDFGAVVEVRDDRRDRLAVQLPGRRASLAIARSGERVGIRAAVEHARAPTGRGDEDDVGVLQRQLPRLGDCAAVRVDAVADREDDEVVGRVVAQRDVDGGPQLCRREPRFLGEPDARVVAIAAVLLPLAAVVGKDEDFAVGVDHLLELFEAAATRTRTSDRVTPITTRHAYVC